MNVQWSMSSHHMCHKYFIALIYGQLVKCFDSDCFLSLPKINTDMGQALNLCQG